MITADYWNMAPISEPLGLRRIRQKYCSTLVVALLLREPAFFPSPISEGETSS